MYFVELIVSMFLVLLTGKRESPVWLWIEPIMSYTFGSLWVIPLFWLSKILNSLWFLVSLQPTVDLTAHIFDYQ